MDVHARSTSGEQSRRIKAYLKLLFITLALAALKRRRRWPCALEKICFLRLADEGQTICHFPRSEAESSTGKFFMGGSL